MPDQKQKIILVVLGLTLAIVWGRAITLQPVYGKNRQKINPQTSAPSAPTSIRAASKQAPFDDWARNPFISEEGSLSESAAHGQSSPKKQAPNSSALHLEGILWDPKSPAAVVNDQMVGVGDSVGSWKVTEIRQDRVLLSKGSSTQTLESN